MSYTPKQPPNENTRKRAKSPSGIGRDWQGTSKPSAFRPTIRNEEKFPPLRDVDSERETKWLNPTKGAKVKSVDKLAR
jgi:hypothetical protein